jgi:diguanylate cyclase
MDTVDWKKKHLDALREMELEERRWKAVESVLRRLAARLCAAAMGLDDRLDVQLSKVSAAVRGRADDVELQALSDSLADAIRALERVPAGGDPNTSTLTRTLLPGSVRTPASAPAAVPATRPVRWQASCAAVDALLARLAADDAPAGVAELRAALLAANEDRELADVLARVTALVTARTDALARERSAAAATLAQVTERLEEMVAYLQTASSERDERRAATDQLSTQVLARVRTLTSAVQSTADLGTLRSLVADRLQDVAAQVREFHTREAERVDQEAKRAERLRARVVELEVQTRGLHRELDQERRKARIDPLTQVANRAAFEERFAAELVRWQRFRAPVSLVLFDVDRFKQVNDTYGHRAGDAALRAVAGCIDARRRAADVLARHGGEEFALLMIGATAAEALAVADDLRERVAGLGLHFRGTPVTLTVSAGITELREGDTGATVFERADQALYRAKNEGRNRCVLG